MDIFELWETEDKLSRLISRLKGECIDCHTPCKKAHPGFTSQCDCCAWIEHMKEAA